MGKSSLLSGILCTISLLLLQLGCLPPDALARVGFGHDVVSSPNKYFSTRERGLDSQAILPPPPDYGSILFQHDRAMYEYGLSLRNSERGKQAVSDCDAHHLQSLFSEAYGGMITAEAMPELFSLIQRVGSELSNMATRTAKQYYKRIRPFVLYNSHTCYQPGEAHARNNASYPSGHSARGWGIALILSEINPGRKELILRRGYEYGQSRVICGYHWQSDVDNARLCAAAAVANLHANQDFMAHLARAKEEYARCVKEGLVETQDSVPQLPKQDDLSEPSSGK